MPSRNRGFQMKKTVIIPSPLYDGGVHLKEDVNKEVAKQIIEDRLELQELALATANYNGHVMQKWKYSGINVATTKCIHCGMSITVNALPKRGSLDARGLALIKECPVPFQVVGIRTLLLVN